VEILSVRGGLGMTAREYSEKRIYMGRLPYGGDVLKSLTEFVKERGIKKGQVQVIGAVQKAVVGFYDQETRKYENIILDKHLEILSLIGNISLKDDQPFIHAHLTLSDEEGKSFGGHLMEGTIVFAGEFIIREFEGENLERTYDEQTGLALWDM
jgi:hypothetical protein